MTGVEARGIVEAGLRRELFGPEADGTPLGNPIDCSKIEYQIPHEGRSKWPVFMIAKLLRRY